MVLKHFSEKLSADFEQRRLRFGFPYAPLGNLAVFLADLYADELAPSLDASYPGSARAHEGV